MGGSLKNTSSRAVMWAAGVLLGGGLMTSAHAADLGGDCCADLEERVAELEATTVRHANRKVRLKLSGQVNSAIMYFDDGFTSDVYVFDNDEASTRIRLDASGTIRPGLTAGLLIEYDIEIAGGNRIGALEADGGVALSKPNDDGNGIELRRANWWIKGDFGRLSIGNGSSASDGALEVSFSNGWVGSIGYGLATSNIENFNARVTPTGNAVLSGIVLNWGQLGEDLDGGRTNRVRYDTPTFAGFTLSAAWGEDDQYDAALRYAGQFGDIRVAAAVSYFKDQDEGKVSAQGGVLNNVAFDRDTYGGSAAVMHQPSGLHLQGGASHRKDDNRITPFESTTWWIAPGIQFRASNLGVTDITAQYISTDIKNFADLAGADLDYRNYGIGLTQDIDPVGGTMYLSFNHHEYEDRVGTKPTFDHVQFGMILRY